MAYKCGVDISGIPDIPHAVIDKRFVDGKDMLRKYPGHYVTVREEGGATYHMSKPGANCIPSSVLVAEGRVFKDGFTLGDPYNYKNTQVIDFANNTLYIYDVNGDVRMVHLSEVA